MAPLIRSDSLALVTVMSHSIPQAVSFYVGVLNFRIKCDEMIKGERLVVAMPQYLTDFTPASALRFREAVTQRDKAAVGNQAGDGIFLQVETDDWETVYDKLKTMGAALLDKVPRQEDDYRAVTVVDPMGNRVNVVEKTTATMGRVFTKDVGK